MPVFYSLPNTNVVRIDALEAKCVSDDCTDTYLNKNVILPYSPKLGNPTDGYLTRISSYPHLNNKTSSFLFWKFLCQYHHWYLPTMNIS